MIYFYCSDKKFYTEDEIKKYPNLKILYSGNSVNEIQNKYLTSVDIPFVSIEYPLRTKDKLQAIKNYREQHKCSLFEAKEAVEKML